MGKNKTLRSDIVGLAARKLSMNTRPVATAVCQAGWHVLFTNVPGNCAKAGSTAALIRLCVSVYDGM